MNLLYFLLLNSNYNSENRISSILDFYKIYVVGSDLRPSDNYKEKQTNFDKILENHKKNGWLNKLESNISQNEKEEFIQNEMESAYRPFNILGGGLFNDWDMDVTQNEVTQNEVTQNEVTQNDD